jgi:hypothetical protein
MQTRISSRLMLFSSHQLHNLALEEIFKKNHDCRDEYPLTLTNILSYF